MFWIAYAVMWISTAVAVIFGIYETGSAWCLWAFLIPAMVDININEGSDETNGEES